MRIQDCVGKGDLFLSLSFFQEGECQLAAAAAAALKSG